MIKKLVLVFVIFFSLQNYAQEGTASPYSFYGIGSLKFRGTAENISMGGLSIYTDSIHVNLQNPASYTGDNLVYYNNESRPVKFVVGGSHSSLDLKSNLSEDKSSATSFDYLALNVPMGKFGLAFGLKPYTSVGYKLEDLNNDETVSSRFTGRGGVNKAFLGLAYQIKKGLGIGIEINYNFGNIENNAIAFRYDSDNIPLLDQSMESNRSDLSGLSFNIGLSYKTMLNDKLELVSGLTFTPKSTLVSKNTRDLSTVRVSDDSEFVTRTVSVDLEALGFDETELALPSKYSFGAGIGAPRKWFIGGEYTSQKISNFSNPLYITQTTVYEDASTISIGGFFIPQYNSFSSYLKRVVYRAGVRQEKTGLNIGGESIKEFGISFGVGLPMQGGISNANLGLEIGKRGTTKNDLIQENFINFHINLSLNDRWFQKRKYN